MKKLSIAFLALATAFALAPAALADSLSFTISGGGTTSSGTISFLTTSTPGVDEITGISGSFADANGNYSGTITSLYPDPSYSPEITTSYLFSVDNLFYPGGAPETCFWGTCAVGEQLDVVGLVFDVTRSTGSIYEVGVWGNGANGYGLDSDLNGVYQDDGNNGVAVLFAAGEEPSCLLLLGSGMLGLAFVLFRKIRLQSPSQG